MPRLIFQLNNARSASTGHTPHEIVKGINPRDVPDLLGGMPAKPNYTAVRVSAYDALAIVAVTMKNHYDRRHTTRFFAVGDMVYLRLHKGYATAATDCHAILQ